MRSHSSFMLTVLIFSFAPSFSFAASTQSPYESTASFFPDGKRPDSAYDKIFPLYAIECSGSQTKKINAKPGGPLGHGFVYLKNICRDTSVAFPKIRKCAPGERDLNSPEGGMVLSLDKNFSNTRFIATDGLDMAINGELNESSELGKAEIDRIVKKVVLSGATRGVKMRNIAQKPPGMSEEEFAARSTLATGFALRFGRDSRCVSIPINEEKLDSAVAWINDQNAELTSGKKEFVWSLGDECDHFAHNVLARMGIGKPVSVGSGKAYQAYLLSSLVWKPWAPILQIPMNEVLSSAERTGEAKIPNVLDLYLHRQERENFLKFHSLAPTEGVLVWAAAIHKQNEIYKTDSEPFFMQIPWIKNRSRKMDRMLKEPKTTVLKTNLEAYQAKIENAIASQPALKDIGVFTYLSHGINASDFQNFYNQYMDYLKSWRNQVQDHRIKLQGF